MSSNSPRRLIEDDSQPSAANSNQLEFTQAMSDFKVMFPNMDADVIEAVLRSNNGAVDTTIDHLLAMSADNEVDKLANASINDKPPDYNGQPPSYQQATKSEPEQGDLIDLDEAAGFTPIAQSNEVKTLSAGLLTDKTSPQHAYTHPKRQQADAEKCSIVPTQHQLHEAYEANMRLRDEYREATKAQYLEDERIALMLQNEEFMAELRRDTDFMSTLDNDQSPDYQGDFTQPGGAPTKPLPKAGKASDDELREKLRNMGKTSKKKFSRLASIFSHRSKNAAKQLLGHSNAPANETLLLYSESDDDDDGADRAGKQKTPTKGKYTSFS